MYHLFLPRCDTYVRLRCTTHQERNTPQQGRVAHLQAFATFGVDMTDADIEPDLKQDTLKVKLQNRSYSKNNQNVQQLRKFLNKSETSFPGTNLRLVYKMISNQTLEG